MNWVSLLLRFNFVTSDMGPISCFETEYFAENNLHCISGFEFYCNTTTLSFESPLQFALVPFRLNFLFQMLRPFHCFNSKRLC